MLCAAPRNVASQHSVGTQAKTSYPYTRSKRPVALVAQMEASIQAWMTPYLPSQVKIMPSSDNPYHSERLVLPQGRGLQILSITILPWSRRDDFPFSLGSFTAQPQWADHPLHACTSLTAWLPHKDPAEHPSTWIAPGCLPIKFDACSGTSVWCQCTCSSPPTICQRYELHPLSQPSLLHWVQTSPHQCDQNSLGDVHCCPLRSFLR